MLKRMLKSVLVSAVVVVGVAGAGGCDDSNRNDIHSNTGDTGITVGGGHHGADADHATTPAHETTNTSSGRPETGAAGGAHPTTQNTPSVNTSVGTQEHPGAKH